MCKDIPGALVTHGRVPFHQYMNEISRSKFAIAMKGVGPWAHREMEICSIGVPMFRDLRGGERMWKSFEPGKHYIAVDFENFPEQLNYYNNNYQEALEIGNAGRQYYDDNHRQAGLQKTFKEIVDTILTS